MTTIAVDSVNNRPKVCAFFAGRAWYAGVESATKGGWLLFSQVASDISRLDKCYQQNDPTSEVFSDIGDDDGGVIPIPEAGEIVALKPLGAVLVVLATNGVWYVRGGDNGFKATEYSVEKASSVGCSTSKSVVVVNESILFWATQAIYALTLEKGLLVSAQNISDATIKSYYLSIPLSCKLRVVGAYNDTEKVVYWAFSNNPDLLTTYGASIKNTLLKFDTRLNAFYIETLPIPTIRWFEPSVRGIAVTKETNEESQSFEVVAVEDKVLVGTDDVVASIPVLSSAAKQTKFVYSAVDTYYMADYKTSRDNFYDFSATEQPAYLITGWNMGGVGPARQKTALYLTVFAKRTEEVTDEELEPTKPSGILMQTRWNFTESFYTGKWSTQYQVYRQLRPYFMSSPGAIEDGYPLVITKNKIRGRGKGLQIKWQAEPGKDMKLVGWTTTFVGNTNV